MTASRKAEQRTDWNRVAAASDQDIERAMRDDEDWRDLIDIDWSRAALVLPARKRAISIRLDEDLIDYFKKSGPGYQGRINAVLRSYVAAAGKRR